ncbi:MAG: glycoside hydrolase family 5 protein [Cyclobacteriaceae bacterium]|nr:glycoside hydrolase family 5 protein [Cyclobacteriaceae bacterium]
MTRIIAFSGLRVVNARAADTKSSSIHFSTKRLFTCVFLGVLFLSLDANAQSTPFHKGVNLTNWFQAPNAQQMHFERYDKDDFETIKAMGCDVIRLPINLHAMAGAAPAYKLDTLFLLRLDQAVTWAEELGLYFILDNHSFDPATDTDPAIGDILNHVWKQLASRYQDRTQLLVYEILNEPHGIADDTWGAIQQEVIDVIRSVDKRHSIMVGGANWNSFHNLKNIPVYDDDNLIYTFHFYDPFLFTHQGATWVAPSMKPLAGVPFPTGSAELPPMPATFSGTWLETAYQRYSSEGTAVRVRELIDIAVAFQQERMVPVFCGEFGVHIPSSPQNDRVYWYKTVRSYLEQKGISWTSWDYHGSFGVFERVEAEGKRTFRLNDPLLEAMGLQNPEN